MDSDRERLLVCMRVQDATPLCVVDGSEQRECVLCFAKVWVSPAGQQMLADETAEKIVCNGR